MTIRIEKYPSFSLRQIEALSVDDVPYVDSTDFYRVELPAHPNNVVEMEKKGYVFADRTLGVEISLKRSKIDYQKLVRFSISNGNADDDVIRQIAFDSFPSDRRFHVNSVQDLNVATQIIDKWIYDLTTIYVCLHKDETVGFLDLEPYGENDRFIHLAAVKERYRAAGAAVSLYAFGIQKAKEMGCEKVYGRVSSSNTAVMNLYSFLGGIFNNPIDVFVRNED